MSVKRRRKVEAATFATPPPERGQHDDLEVKAFDPANRGARRVQIRTPNRLAKYRRLESISEEQFQAGEELAATWARAGLLQRVTVNLLSTGGGRRDITDVQVGARQALIRALDGDRAPFADMLVSCCVFDESVPTPRLRRGLTLLALHYGLIRTRRQ